MIANKEAVGMIILFIICLGVVFVYLYSQMSREEQIAKVKEWLLYACTIAEKELGAKTGKLKLRMVYDMFVSKFSWVAKIITFDDFSAMVDETLEQMKDMIANNEAVKVFIENA